MIGTDSIIQFEGLTGDGAPVYDSPFPTGIRTIATSLVLDGANARMLLDDESDALRNISLNSGKITLRNGALLHILGDFTQSSTSEIKLEVGGPTIGVNLPQLVVHGLARLAGIFNVQTLNGFLPAPGVDLPLMYFNRSVGKFTNDLKLDLGGNTFLSLLARTSDVVAIVVDSTKQLPVNLLTIQPKLNTEFSGRIAEINDPEENQRPEAFLSVIDWGDGLVTSGTVVLNTSGRYDVLASHVYSLPGTVRLSLRVFKKNGALTILSTELSIAR